MSMPIELAEQISKAINQQVNENLKGEKWKQRDQLLLDLVQGLDTLNTMAETGNISKNKSYPKTLMNQSCKSPRSTTDNQIKNQRKLEELLDTPHSVNQLRGGWWSIDLRRQKGELQLYQERGVAKGIGCIGNGRSIKKSRKGYSVKYNRKFNKDVPTSATGEEGKYACDIRMSLGKYFI